MRWSHLLEQIQTSGRARYRHFDRMMEIALNLLASLAVGGLFVLVNAAKSLSAPADTFQIVVFTAGTAILGGLLGYYQGLAGNGIFEKFLRARQRDQLRSAVDEHFDSIQAESMLTSNGERLEAP